MRQRSTSGIEAAAWSAPTRAKFSGAKPGRVWQGARTHRASGPQGPLCSTACTTATAFQWSPKIGWPWSDWTLAALRPTSPLTSPWEGFRWFDPVPRGTELFVQEQSYHRRVSDRMRQP